MLEKICIQIKKKKLLVTEQINFESHIATSDNVGKHSICSNTLFVVMDKFESDLFL